jgi:hypothetical protein
MKLKYDFSLATLDEIRHFKADQKQDFTIIRLTQARAQMRKRTKRNESQTQNKRQSLSQVKQRQTTNPLCTGLGHSRQFQVETSQDFSSRATESLFLRFIDFL